MAEPMHGLSRGDMCTKRVHGMQGGMQGQVRSWVDWPEAGLLLLNMRGNRWCGNVGRAHKSNGIFYVVDLQACGDPTDAVALPA